ncbi:unnamed protein product [Paramecium octaurelia]|uniref:RING-type domain-containing protein n=1 Tax=Paramecium octaurelia TaxID=43137 RepID=A0A8S1VD02_PAROT|nr:unnamed protein product [Paramecium octaurelia]
MNEQFLNCRLCSIEFDQAMHLPSLLNECGHTVCEQCIKSQEGHFRFPADETLQECQIDGFSINTTLFQLKQKPKQNDLLKLNSLVYTRIIQLQNFQKQILRFLINSYLYIKYHIPKLKIKEMRYCRKLKINSIISLQHQNGKNGVTQPDRHEMDELMLIRRAFMHRFFHYYYLQEAKQIDQHCFYRCEKNQKNVFSSAQIGNSQQKEQCLTKKIFDELKQIQIHPALSKKNE